MRNDMREPVSDEESLRLLREFLGQLERMLGGLVEHPGPVIPGRHHEKMYDAWVELRPSFEAAAKKLKRPNKTIMNNLKEVGLVGHQLVFKISIFQHAYDELADQRSLRETKPKKRKKWQRFLRFFKPALKAADVILGSLATFIPGVESIKEYKESVESGIELGEATRT